MKKHLRQLFTNKYGKTPDLNVLNRFKSELKLFEAIRESNDIIKASIDIHNIAYSDRYFFFGSNSASWLISNLLGITKSNPLPAHYHCDSCKRIFWSNVQYSFDLPAQICTCGNLLHSEGYNYNLYNQFFYRKNFTMLFTCKCQYKNAQKVEYKNVQFFNRSLVLLSIQKGSLFPQAI